MYFFGWGRRKASIGGAGTRHCARCRLNTRVEASIDYRYFHLLWLIGAIVTRSYVLACARCGATVPTRSSRLRKPARCGNTRFLALGPIFLIVLGGALLLIGPADYSD